MDQFWVSDNGRFLTLTVRQPDSKSFVCCKLLQTGWLDLTAVLHVDATCKFAGPMVYGTCYSPLKYKTEVERIGFAGIQQNVPVFIVNAYSCVYLFIWSTCRFKQPLWTPPPTYTNATPFHSRHGSREILTTIGTKEKSLMPCSCGRGGTLVSWLVHWWRVTHMLGWSTSVGLVWMWWFCFHTAGCSNVYFHLLSHFLSRSKQIVILLSLLCQIPKL